VDKALKGHRVTGYLKSLEEVFQLARVIVKSTEQAMDSAYEGEVHESLLNLMSPKLKTEWPYEIIKSGTATVVTSGRGDYAIVVNA